jgi:hypothetical protein
LTLDSWSAPRRHWSVTVVPISEVEFATAIGERQRRPWILMPLPDQRDQPVANPLGVIVIAFQPSPKCLFLDLNAHAEQNGQN